MMKNFYKLVVLLLLCQTYAFAQNISVTGKVTDSENLPVPGVSVRVTGTTQGVSTDANGNFSLTVPSNATLTVTSIGYASQTIPVQGRTTLNIRLADDATQLGEVVVTALGIERSSKSLTYNTTTVSADDLNQVKNANVLNSLAGKAAGVFVTQGGGGPGAAPRVIMRGNKSITGNNQPLYVVDGVPGINFDDFNSEDVETMQVLQGASAAALYGSRAANGVILITTKKGRPGTTNVDFTSTATFDRPFVLPEIQTEYGQGLGGVGPGPGNTYASSNASWGPKIANGNTNHIDDFFRTGENYINSISVSSGNANQRIYFSYANTDAKAMIPNYDFVRHNATVRGSTSAFNNKVTIDGGINFIRNNTMNARGGGWYNNPMFGLYLFPMGDDMSKYSANGGAVWNSTRNLWAQNWPYIVNEHSSNENPYWIQNFQERDNINDRTVFNAGAKWSITNWANLAYRATYNRSNGTNEERISATTDPTNASPNGNYSKSFSNNQRFYNDLLLSAGKTVAKNIDVNGVAGFVFEKNTNTGISSASSTTQPLAYPNYFSVYGIPGGGTYTESLSKGANYAVLGSATIGWKQTLFLDLTGRNEWSSTTPDDFFYPSAGLSYILTETIGSQGILSFAKIRGSYSEVGNALDNGNAERNPFLSVSGSANTTGVGPSRAVNGTPSSLPFFSGTDTIDLKPERTSGFEVGAELRFFEDKLNLSVTYYNQTTDDQVFTIGAPSGAGAANFYINGGTIQNRGVEAALGFATNISRNVKWNVGMNFSANNNRIKSLSNLLATDRFDLNTGNRLTSLYLLRPGSSLLGGREYGSYHDLFGRAYVRDAAGNLTYHTTGANAGLPVVTTSTVGQYVGTANPDFLLNMSNQFSYKAFTFSFLVDGRFGGLTSSSTEQWLDYKGLSQRSADARNAGGVSLPNGTKVNPELYYGYISAKADNGAVAEEYLFDTTNIRMREIALGYRLPKLFNGLRNATLSLVARNAFFFYKKAPFDPEIANGTGNGAQGFESFQLPTPRSFGVTLRAGF